jgi:hypothetical protein
MRRPSPLLLHLVWLLFAAAGSARGQSFPQQVFKPTPQDLRRALSDEWYGAYYRGQKCGYSRIRLSETAQAFVYSRNVKWKITSMENKLEVVSRERYEFDKRAPYGLRLGRLLSRNGADETDVRAERVGRSFRVTIKNASGTQTHTRKILPYTFLDAAGRYFVTRPQAQGALKVIQVDLAKWVAGATVYRVMSNKQIKRYGVASKIFRCKIEAAGKLVGEAILDEHGAVLKEHLFGLAELRTEPKELAQQAEYSSDLFEGGMAKIDTKIGDPMRVTKLSLQVGGKSRRRLTSFGGVQMVTRADGKTFVTVSTKGSRPRVTAAERRKALEVNAAIPWRHATVRALARRAVGGETRPAEQVRRLVTFVSDYVQDAYGKNATSCLRVIETKQGDCTEHSTLFTALCRAQGIPCRFVYGVAYMGDEEQAFGGHAWNEVELKGEWVAVDSTWNQARVDATHVRFGTSETEVGRLLGRIKFRLLAVER